MLRPFVVALLLVVPLAAASGAFPPGDAPLVEVGPTRLAHWIGEDPSLRSGEPGATMEVTRGGNATLHLGLEKPTQVSGNETNATETFFVAYVNVTSSELGIDESALIRMSAMISLVWDFTNVTFVVPDSAPDNATYSFSVDLHEEREGNATLLGNATGEGAVSVASAELPAPPAGLPLTWLLAGAAVLVLGGGAIAYGVHQRNERRRMNEGPRRSQVMREVELERKLERAKDPTKAQEIKQEIRAQEVVREKRRELQILEAKRADALKTIDLLKKRHETGGLTRHQLDNMVAKKQADLARIDQEIAEMERQDGGGAAA